MCENSLEVIGQSQATQLPQLQATGAVFSGHTATLNNTGVQLVRKKRRMDIGLAESSVTPDHHKLPPSGGTFVHYLPTSLLLGKRKTSRPNGTA